MPGTVQDHYDNLLAEHYDWMFGDSFELKVAEQKALLNQVARAPRRGELAVDLGCGSGFQQPSRRPPASTRLREPVPDL